MKMKSCIKYRHETLTQSNASEAEVNHLAGSAVGHALLVVS